MSEIIVGYSRFEPQRDRADEMSIEIQEQAIEEYAERTGLKVVGKYLDIENTTKRHDLKRAMRHCATAKADLVVLSLSRLSKNTGDCLALLDKLRSQGSGIRSITENFENESPMGKLVFTMLTGFNQFFLDAQATSIKTVAAFRKQNGLKRGSQAPFGYRFDGNTVIIDEREQEAISWLKTAIQRGVQVTDMADQLTLAGFRQRNGEAWRAGNLYRLVRRLKSEMVTA